ncbi:MAG TPA: DsrE family protein [Puia sp.]|nr:DsrE family protein [Puia sp.]
MNNMIFVFSILLSGPVFLQAQKPDYQVVFDLTSKDSLDEKSVIRWLNEVAVPNPEGKFEVVMYGKGFNLVLKNNSTCAADIVKLAAYKNISFKVCAVAMKNNHVEKDDLLSCVEIVPDGIYEIISKQKSGWGYIKAVH